jgi:hypothetical protein
VGSTIQAPVAVPPERPTAVNPFDAGRNGATGRRDDVPLAVVTPTHAADLALFERLHASVLDNTPASTVHYAIVNVPDVPVFSRFSGPRCRLLTVSDLFPGTFFQVPGRKVWLHRRRAWPPVRGWVMQQLLKMQAVASLDAVTLVADSDVVVVRPVDASRFGTGKEVVLYSRPNAVHPGMPRHVRWHHVARRLLDLPPAAPPFDDYVTSFNVWVPDVVRAMIRRIEEVNRVSWEQAVGAQLHVSEFILYGVFVTGMLPEDQIDVRAGLGCLEYWETSPLDQKAGLRLAETFTAQDVAVMISAKSHTPEAVLDEVIAACRARARPSAPIGPSTPNNQEQ